MVWIKLSSVNNRIKLAMLRHVLNFSRGTKAISLASSNDFNSLDSNSIVFNMIS